MSFVYSWAFILGCLALYSFFPVWQLKKQGPVQKAAEIPIDKNAVAHRLCRAISCETTGYVDENTGNYKEFIKLQQQIREDYPAVFSTVTIHEVKPYSRLYCWKGKTGDKKPILLMAHQDVVPVTSGTETDWKYPPFAGAVAEGCIWGRGAIDMKNALCGIFEAMEHLIQQGFVPSRDVYLCTTCDEELMGPGSGRVADLCRELGLHFEFVLDEGGSFMRGEMLGAKNTLLGCVCTYEKGYCDVKLSTSDEGGHDACPKGETALSRMARALMTIERNKLPVDISDTFLNMYRTVAPYCGFKTKWMAAHPRRYARKLAHKLAQSGVYGNALVRTTTALTQISASNAPNVLPQHVWANVNFRINPGFTYEALREIVKKLVGPEFTVELPVKSNPSRPAHTDTAAYEAIATTIRETFGADIVVTPMAFFAGTDSRMFTDLSDDVYKFMPAKSHMKYASTMHGTNERIDVDDYVNGIKFYIRFLKRTCGGEA